LAAAPIEEDAQRRKGGQEGERPVGKFEENLRPGVVAHVVESDAERLGRAVAWE
jgi:hypothetical protein